jgi:hypothetical protein
MHISADFKKFLIILLMIPVLIVMIIAIFYLWEWIQDERYEGLKEYCAQVPPGVMCPRDKCDPMMSGGSSSGGIVVEGSIICIPKPR